MRKKLEDEIQRMIDDKRDFPVYSTDGRLEWWDLSEIVRLILCHLNLEPHTECKYPNKVLRSTTKKEEKK